MVTSNERGESEFLSQIIEPSNRNTHVFTWFHLKTVNFWFCPLLAQIDQARPNPLDYIKSFCNEMTWNAMCFRSLMLPRIKKELITSGRIG